MLFTTALPLLAATMAVAAPNKRQSEPNLRVSLTDTPLFVTAEYNASTDGTHVAVDSTLIFDEAKVECIEICIPEFHCTLYDKSSTPVVTLPPGTSQIDPPSQVGLIICGTGLPETKREVNTPEARQTKPYDGAAVFTNNQTGWETGFAFYLGETIDLAERTLYYSSATVQDVTVPPNKHWSCEAFGEDGGSLGVFYASDRFIYSFVPGVVASFLCK